MCCVLYWAWSALINLRGGRIGRSGEDRSATGYHEETGLLSEWPQEGPRLLWQVADLGGGYSTPAVVGERLYLQTNQGTSDESVEARAAVDGKKLWSTRIGKVGNPDQRPNYPAARSTPTVDGQRLYALGSDGDLACLDIGTGKVQWQRNIRKDFGGQPGEWAYSESPLVDSNVVVCTPGGADATLVALDKNSGEVVWKSAVAGGDPAGYASIIKVETDGLQQYVQFLGKGLVGVEATTGKVLWRYDRTGSGPANIPTPVANDSLVYSGGAKSGGGLVRLSVKDGNVEAAEVYFDMGLPNGIGGAVQVGQHLYGSIAAGLVCLEFQSGKNAVDQPQHRSGVALLRRRTTIPPWGKQWGRRAGGSNSRRVSGTRTIHSAQPA